MVFEFFNKNKKAPIEKAREQAEKINVQIDEKTKMMDRLDSDGAMGLYVAEMAGDSGAKIRKDAEKDLKQAGNLEKEIEKLKGN
jgi:hypothetical protein